MSAFQKTDFQVLSKSVYFLQWQAESQLLNDFYISRLFARGHSRTLVVFQKTHAWNKIDGGLTVPGRLETILDLFPSPVQIEVRRIIFIVIDYEVWKQMVRQKQSSEGT